MKAIFLLIPAALLAAASTAAAGRVGATSDVAAAQPIPRVKYIVINNAVGTVEGDFFDRSFGVQSTQRLMADASRYIWSVLGQTYPVDTKVYTTVTLFIVQTMKNAGLTMNNEIWLNAAELVRFRRQAAHVLGLLVYHEMTHVWQHLAGYQGNHTIGVVEGIADYVAIEAGYRPLDCLPPDPVSNYWYEGYCTTADFLRYLAKNWSSSIVADLNRMMALYYTDDYFEALLQSTPDSLWKEYLASPYTPHQLQDDVLRLVRSHNESSGRRTLLPY